MILIKISIRPSDSLRLLNVTELYAFSALFNNCQTAHCKVFNLKFVAKCLTAGLDG